MFIIMFGAIMQKIMFYSNVSQNNTEYQHDKYFQQSTFFLSFTQIMIKSYCNINAPYVLKFALYISNYFSIVIPNFNKIY